MPLAPVVFVPLPLAPAPLPLVPAPLAPLPVPFALPGVPLPSVLPGIPLPEVLPGVPLPAALPDVALPVALPGIPLPFDPDAPPLVPPFSPAPRFVRVVLPDVETLVALFRPDVEPLVFEADDERFEMVFFSGFFLLREPVFEDAVARRIGDVAEPEAFVVCARTADVIAALESVSAKTAAKSRFIKGALPEIVLVRNRK